MYALCIQYAETQLNSVSILNNLQCRLLFCRFVCAIFSRDLLEKSMPFPSDLFDYRNDAIYCGNAIIALAIAHEKLELQLCVCMCSMSIDINQRVSSKQISNDQENERRTQRDGERNTHKISNKHLLSLINIVSNRFFIPAC